MKDVTWRGSFQVGGRDLILIPMFTYRSADQGKLQKAKKVKQI